MLTEIRDSNARTRIYFATTRLQNSNEEGNDWEHTACSSAPSMACPNQRQCRCTESGVFDFLSPPSQPDMPMTTLIPSDSAVVLSAALPDAGFSVDDSAAPGHSTLGLCPG